MMLVPEFKIQLLSDIKNLKQLKSDMFEKNLPTKLSWSTNANLNVDITPTSVKATFHLTISMRRQRATGKIQRNNYQHGNCGPS